MAKFLANENVPSEAVATVRLAGHDLAWIAELSPGVDDNVVLATALSQGRVLVTFDKDFGEMAFQLDGGMKGKHYGMVAVNDKRKTSPGTNTLGKLLAASGPTLILMDEILVYLVKAGGVHVVERQRPAGPEGFPSSASASPRSRFSSSQSVSWTW